MFAAAARGDTLAQRLVDEVVEHLAMTIVDVAAMLDPERIVLDGSIGRPLEPFLPRLVDLVAPAVLYPPEICVSALTPSAALVGAVHEAWRLLGG